MAQSLDKVTLLASGLFKKLAGNWVLDRKISCGIQMIGTASFQPLAKPYACYHYQEKGTIKLPSNKSYTAYNAYGYSHTESQIMIHFWDTQRDQLGSVLHCLNFSLGNHGLMASKHIYYCGSDCYELNYTFIGESELKIEYQVSGPKKNYLIDTSLSRLT